MNVVIVSAVFPPEPAISALTSAQLAQALVEEGHKVTVITNFPNRPGGKIHNGYRRKLYTRTKNELGYLLIRCFCTFSPISSMLSRLLENVSFGITSGFAALTISRPDVIYSNSWPIFSTGILSIIAKLRRIPIILTIQDIYPESIIAQHRINQKSHLAKFLLNIDKMIAQNANAVIVISKPFFEIYTKTRGIEKGRLNIIPNWTEDYFCNQIIEEQSVRKKFDIPGSRFLIVFGGNIGKATGLETVIKAISLFSFTSSPYLLIAGEGSSLEECKSMAQRVGYHIIFFSPWPREETAPTYLCADLLILPTYAEQSFASVPSKLISYMLSGKPILAMAIEKSEIESIIQHSGCGWVIKPDRPDLLMEKIQEIMHLPPDVLEKRGRAGREYALIHFSGQVNLPKIIRLLEITSVSNIP